MRSLAAAQATAGQEQGETSTSGGASDSHVEARAPGWPHVTESRLTLLAA